MTRTRPTRASWSAAAVVSPVVAALAAGSILWAASHNPLATAGETPAAAPVAAAQQVSGAAPVEVLPTVAKEQPTLAQLRKKAKRLQRAVAQARKEARAAREAGIVSAGESGWVTPSSNGASSSGGGGNGGGSNSGGGNSGSGNSGAAAQPAPQPAPEPPPADTWTGSSGG